MVALDVQIVTIRTIKSVLALPEDAPQRLHVLRLCSVFEPPASAIGGRGARFDPVGGMQEHTGSLTRALERRGVAQVVLTARPPTAPRVERIAPGATVVRVSLPVRRPRQLYSLPAAVLAPLLGRHADLVHVHLGEDLAILPLAGVAAHARRLPIVLTVHCSLAHTLAVHDARSALLRTLGGWIERRGERRADATLVYTDRLARRIARDGGDRVLVVRRGVDRRLFAGAHPRPFPELGGHPRVVFVGRLVRAKGTDVLVEAAARVHTPGMRLLVVGDGPDRARIERAARRLGIATRFHVTGFVGHERIPAILRSADLLVLPSLYEELGTVLVEAQQVGLPVVASRVGGIPEVIQHGVNGLLVAPGDAAELARAIDTILGDADLRARLGAAAAEGAWRFDLERVEDEVLTLYEGLAEAWRERHGTRFAPPLAARARPMLWPA
jgi:glycogen(starch) synthase